MSMEGDALDGQPSEGVTTLTGLAEGLDVGDETPEELPEDEAGDESEVEGDPEAEDEAEDEQGEDDPTVKLKHDGKEIEVKLSEALNLAQQGYDYTKKTMVVAEEREAAKAEREQAAHTRQQYEHALNTSVDRLNGYISFMESELGAPPPVELLSHDSTTYLIQKEQYEGRKGKLQQAFMERQRLNEEHARHRQAWINQRAAETEKALRDTLPDWNDKSIDTLAEYASKQGLAPNAVPDSLLEPGFWLLVNKAKAYDDLQAQKSTLKPVKQVPKVVKTPATPQPQQLAKHQEKVRNFNSRPSLNTLADLL